jgi:hypothetical protein
VWTKNIIFRQIIDERNKLVKSIAMQRDERTRLKIDKIPTQLENMTTEEREKYTVQMNLARGHFVHQLNRYPCKDTPFIVQNV